MESSEILKNYKKRCPEPLNPRTLESLNLLHKLHQLIGRRTQPYYIHGLSRIIKKNTFINLTEVSRFTNILNSN